MADNNYSILIIGDGGVGKSSYVRKVNTGNFKLLYLIYILRYNRRKAKYIPKRAFRQHLYDKVRNRFDCNVQERLR